MKTEEKFLMNSDKRFQMWDNILGKREDIMDTCSLREHKTNKILNFITEEEKSINNKNINKDDNPFKKEENRRGHLSILPERVSNNINETRRLNNELKRKVDDITKMNAVYVMKQTGSNQNGKDTLLPLIETNRNTLVNNFRYVSETYRKQLMRAFLNYNPIIHLNNLRNLLEKADPEIKKDINNLWNNIEKDLKEVLDPAFHRKKYKKLIADKILFTGNTESIIEKNLPSPSIVKLGEGKMSWGNRKTTRIKEKSEFDNYKECLFYIMNSVSGENIENYINDVKNMPNLPIEKQFNKYFHSLKLAEDLIINYQSSKLNKNTNNEIKNTQDKVNEHHKKMLEYIRQTKAELIKKLLETNKEVKYKK